MWLKLCLLLVYICILFLLSRVLEAISWCDPGHSGVLSRQFLDPMLQSVAKLKSLLENRGVSYDAVVEKSELTSLVETSGPVTAEEIESSCLDEGTDEETNFTSGAHFIEQVEDAKDSVWLVQVVMHSHHIKLIRDKHWNNVKKKASRFGVRTGILDCSLDIRYCQKRNWNLPVVILALPSHFEEKANVIMYNYSGSLKETAILRWIRDKINERIIHIKDLQVFREWQSLPDNWLNSEIQAVLYSQSTSAPLFFSALSVKFPGRVKFGLVQVTSKNLNLTRQELISVGKRSPLPAYIIYSAEGKYLYGTKAGEDFSFANMELFLKCLYPCLNDIFIISFCVANVMSWLEFFITNCSIFRRFRKLMWCIFKYNVMVILLWLPIIGLFQMPLLDRVPLMFLKLQRMFTTSDFGSVLRGDFVFYINNPLYVYFSFILYLIVITFICKKYRDVDEIDENWFNYTQMQTLTHLRPNNLLEPVRISGGFDIFGSGFSQTSLWLQPAIPTAYIQNLPTWKYVPVSISKKAAENSRRVEMAMLSSAVDSVNEMEQAAVESVHLEPVSVAHPAADAPDSAQASSPTNSHSTPRSGPCDYQKPFLSRGRGTADSGLAGHSGNCSKCSHNNLPSASSPPAHPEVSTNSDGFCSCQATNKSDDTRARDGGEKKSCDSDSLACQGFPKGFIESHQCVICLDEYAPHTMLCGLPCGHVFHESCIISWLNLEKHFCPMCRWPSFTLPTQSS